MNSVRENKTANSGKPQEEISKIVVYVTSSFRGIGLTDVQYADAEPEGERHYRASIPKLKAAVADLAKHDLPFSLHLGDMIDRDFASFAAVLPLLEPLGHPVRHLLGNHDITLKSVLHQPETTAYSVIRLYQDRLVIDGRGREKSRTLPLRKIS